MTTPSQEQAFIPALHYHILTPVYEWLARPLIGKTWRAMVEEIVTRAPDRGSVTDMGCGPGTVLRRVRRERSDLFLEGFDIDPKIVHIAERKARDMRMTFARASCDHLPLPDQSRDIAISNMVFHHLPLATKHATLTEVKRILKPGGTFLLCDFSAPQAGQRVRSLRTALTGFLEPEVVPQFEGQLFTLAREANATIETLRTFYGGISLHLLRFPNKA